MPDFGININGEGEPVGLWFDPMKVLTDGHAYVNMSISELQLLTGQIIGAVSKESHESV